MAASRSEFAQNQKLPPAPKPHRQTSLTKKEHAVALPLDKSVVLVGLMGSGKTSVGRRLAAMLGMEFCDSDDEIVKAAGRPIPDIFAEFGEAYFRDGETKVLRRLMDGPPMVIATGGGAFASALNREIIATGGTSVWLTAALDVLWSRVKDKPGRPLLDVPDPYARLAALAAEREPYYSLADVKVISKNNETHETVATRIIDGVHAFRAEDASEQS